MKDKRVWFDHGPFGNKHNRIFRPGLDTNLNACVGKNGGPANFDRYSEGYFEAANRLVESIKENPWDVDRLVYPLVMVYRHGIETALKHLMRVLPFLCDDEDSAKPTHKLLDNWRKVRKYLKHLDEDEETLDWVENIIKDIVDIDPNGENFRYPETKDGNRVLQETSLINVGVFGEELAKLGKYFEGCSYWASKLQEDKCDQMQEDMIAAKEMEDFYR